MHIIPRSRYKRAVSSGFTHIAVFEWFSALLNIENVRLPFRNWLVYMYCCIKTIDSIIMDALCIPSVSMCVCYLTVIYHVFTCIGQETIEYLLSHDVTVIQWITPCHKNHMTTHVITLWREHVSHANNAFLNEITFILKAVKSYFKGS